VELAHRAGAKFGYILTSNAMHLVESIIDCGVDVLIGVDPAQYDLVQLEEMARGKMCLWGGVNGHLTVETGTPEEVQREVQHAMQTLGRRNRFILSPVDNIRQWSPEVERNVKALLGEWKRSSTIP